MTAIVSNRFYLFETFEQAVSTVVNYVISIDFNDHLRDLNFHDRFTAFSPERRQGDDRESIVSD
jgi:hypothetical protein